MKRFTTYVEQTLPIVKKYEEMGKLVRIDANAGVEEVFDRLKKYF